MPQRLPRLLIESAASPPPPRPDPFDPAVAVWRDTNNAAVAYCYAVDGKPWIWLPDTVTFRLAPPDVIAIPDPGVDAGAIRDWFHRFALPMTLQVEGHEVLHAGAVRMSHGVVALCGESHTGKSTLAYGLSGRGYPQWADDVVAFASGIDAATAVALPFRRNLRTASAAYFCGQSRTQSRGAEFDQPPGEEAPLLCVCLLERVAGEPGAPTVTVSRLPASRAFLGLLPHALSFSATEAGARRRLIEHYLALAGSTPVFAVRFQAGFERLPEILDAIEQVADAGHANQLPTGRV